MKQFLLLTTLMGMSFFGYSQISYDGAFGKGLQFETKDSTFSMDFTTRFQPRWDFFYDLDDESVTDRMSIKRARLKFDGYFINPKLRYKLEYDVVGGYVRDAVMKYRFAPKWDLWFGQTKLPGNRERLYSSGNLEFVDRSIFNAVFTLDRDLGFQLHNYFNAGKMVIREQFALSAGNGILDLQASPGVELTGKVELLPFGDFTKKGDYIGADIYREEHVKVSIAFGVDYNMMAYKSNGQVGTRPGADANLFLVFGDILLKYRGISFLVEAAHRSTPDQSPLVYDSEGVLIGSFYTGYGMNFQGGYVFKSMWAISGRYSFIAPDVSYYPDRSEYLLGLSKYIVGNKFKVQANISYNTQEYNSDFMVGSLQMELQF
jgi:hypothetical protein